MVGLKIMLFLENYPHENCVVKHIIYLFLKVCGMIRLNNAGYKFILIMVLLNFNLLLSYLLCFMFEKAGGNHATLKIRTTYKVG